MTHSLHEKLFSAFRTFFSEMDAELLKYSECGKGVSQDVLGISKSFQCSQTDSINLLKEIEFKTSPYDMLICLQTVKSKITETIYKHLNPSPPLLSSSPPLHSSSSSISSCSSGLFPSFSFSFPAVRLLTYPRVATDNVSADDLLPLLIYVILQAQIPCLHTCSFYMERLTFADIAATEFGLVFFFAVFSIKIL